MRWNKNTKIKDSDTNTSIKKIVDKKRKRWRTNSITHNYLRMNGSTDWEYSIGNCLCAFGFEFEIDTLKHFTKMHLHSLCQCFVHHLECLNCLSARKKFHSAHFIIASIARPFVQCARSMVLWRSCAAQFADLPNNLFLFNVIFHCDFLGCRFRSAIIFWMEIQCEMLHQQQSFSYSLAVVRCTSVDLALMSIFKTPFDHECFMHNRDNVCGEQK